MHWRDVGTGEVPARMESGLSSRQGHAALRMHKGERCVDVLARPAVTCMLSNSSAAATISRLMQPALPPSLLMTAIEHTVPYLQAIVWAAAPYGHITAGCSLGAQNLSKWTRSLSRLVQGTWTLAHVSNANSAQQPQC